MQQKKRAATRFTPGKSRQSDLQEMQHERDPLAFDSLFQICQPLLHGLNLELETCQIGFQSGDLLSLGLEPAREMFFPATVTTTRAPVATLTGTVLAVT
jgi:hypothetical protein